MLAFNPFARRSAPLNRAPRRRTSSTTPALALPVVRHLLVKDKVAVAATEAFAIVAAVAMRDPEAVAFAALPLVLGAAMLVSGLERFRRTQLAQGS
mmetsp:Transcript_38641/g.94634  ORF Transcript_38641/g.94634 Transcript_38641/m.94634 type:complete len:96 (-) Transcript_38641:281-568(-)|eukprot:CAMPEP_0198318460 /NCGR_PEP_ID=MMETSP1450-20131203/7780_1 /TAXON_ID=753684 ORGANISM="Madagascaria erythrocladiodes, Strain CCMP3234" /NCGR_SAMPLE_ID=MMETSP1450 /ASSEMBLY_ACC=CAM_ASM_001115 /LENGTH=95 /DNA_ID=CAMNT_0044021757 /DNA_START=150 /DNA_END=437 /DNA_ORIENTATION=-